MWKRRKARVLTRERLSDYEFFLREQEKAGNTVKKYMQSLASLRSHLAGAPITKAALIEWKEELVREYAPASVNAMIAAVNSFLNFMEWTDCRIQPLKIQRAIFRREEKELTRSECPPCKDCGKNGKGTAGACIADDYFYRDSCLRTAVHYHGGCALRESGGQMQGKEQRGLPSEEIMPVS